MAVINGEIPTPFQANIIYSGSEASGGFNNNAAFVDYFGSVGTYTRTLLIGQTSNTLVDPLFWSTAMANGGSVTDGQQVFNVHTGTNTAGTATLTSMQRALVQSGALNLFSGFATFLNGVVPPNNCTVTFGILNAVDGIGFQWRNGVFGVVSRLGGVETFTAALNGATPNINYAVGALWSILYAAGGAVLYYGSTKIHTFVGPLGNISNFPMRCEVRNTGSVVDTRLQFGGLVIARCGTAEIRSTSAFLNTAGTTVLKHGPGTLTSLIVGSPSKGGTITIYDNTSATGTPLAVLDNSVSVSYTFDLDFQVGLTIVLIGTPSVTVILQ